MSLSSQRIRKDIDYGRYNSANAEINYRIMKALERIAYRLENPHGKTSS